MTQYYILSGEGEIGSWIRLTTNSERVARRTAAQLRCGGDRWARVFRFVPETTDWIAHIYDIDNGDARDIPKIA